MKALRQQIKLMAPTNGRVLIYGESGTGKELIGRAMHAESLRRDRVFVELNCAAIPEDHIETELFGYRRGAMPAGSTGNGAPLEKRGTFERADGGTLFLDEVGDMSLKTQARVLRALDEQSFLPSAQPTPSTSTCASSPPPTRPRRGDRARQLPRRPLLPPQRHPLFVPPLRDRKEGHSLAGQGIPPGVRPAVWPPARRDAPRRARRPASVPLARQRRELRNLIERVLILTPKPNASSANTSPLVSRETARDSAKSASRNDEFSTLLEAREAYERDYILKKLDECGGNVTRAAEALAWNAPPLPQDESPRRQRQGVKFTGRRANQFPSSSCALRHTDAMPLHQVTRNGAWRPSRSCRRNQSRSANLHPLAWLLL